MDGPTAQHPEEDSYRSVDFGETTVTCWLDFHAAQRCGSGATGATRGRPPPAVACRVVRRPRSHLVIFSRALCRQSPALRPLAIGGDTVRPIAKHISEQATGAGESLFGRALQPAYTLNGIVVDAFAQQVHEAEVVLGLGVAPPCRAAIPSCSPREILWDHIAPRIRRTDVVLPHRVPRKVRKKQVPDEIESPRHVSLGHSYAKAQRTATAFCGRSNGLLGDLSSASAAFMTLKARVCAGRLVVDEPTDLPDGTEVELLPLDPGEGGPRCSARCLA